jgi:Rv0078B-related antitoxin
VLDDRSEIQLHAMRPLDTSTKSLERQREAFRRMTPEHRLALAAEMSDEIRAVAEAGIRRRHPDYSDEEVRAALVEILLGRENVERALAGRRSSRQ